MANSVLTDKEIMEKLIDLDSKHEGDSMTPFETGFLDTVTRLAKHNSYYLSSGQREHGLRVLEKYKWL